MSTTFTISSPTRPARLTTARVLKLMRGGAVLRCSYNPTVWELSNGWEVSTSVANKITTNPDIAGVGDCLFSSELSQTWRFIGR